MDEFGIGIISTGHVLPTKEMTNDQICEHLDDVTPEWIIEKTGIKKRYYVDKDQNASDLAIAACKKVLSNTELDIRDVGLIVVASFSQDYLFPPLSAKIHKELSASKECQIIDLNTNCVGLVTALTMASDRMKNSDIKYSLIIGVEVLSRFTNLHDENTAVFFGDGASAVLLGRVAKMYGIQSSKFMTDSSTYESVRLVKGGSSNLNLVGNAQNKYSFIEQNSLATWKQAITNLPKVITKLIASNDLTNDDIDFIIFHQANKVLINYVMKKMRIDSDKTFTNVEEIGNTGSASIGIALSQAIELKYIKADQYLLIAGVGAGFNFGASLWKMQLNFNQ
ncbi:MAG: ketoacyl-ACP synthase III [Saprospiraceae bacterium]